MKFFLLGRGVIILGATKFERRSFCRSGDTARAKSRIYYASNSVHAAWRLKSRFFSKFFFLISDCFYVLRTCFWP